MSAGVALKPDFIADIAEVWWKRTTEPLINWIVAVGWEALLNRRGTTWRKLADADKADVDAAKARALMVEHPALIKRPVFESDGHVIVGFGAAEKEALAGE